MRRILYRHFGTALCLALLTRGASGAQGARLYQAREDFDKVLAECPPAKSFAASHRRQSDLAEDVLKSRDELPEVRLLAKMKLASLLIPGSYNADTPVDLFDAKRGLRLTEEILKESHDNGDLVLAGSLRARALAQLGRLDEAEKQADAMESEIGGVVSLSLVWAATWEELLAREGKDEGDCSAWFLNRARQAPRTFLGMMAAEYAIHDVYSRKVDRAAFSEARDILREYHPDSDSARIADNAWRTREAYEARLAELAAQRQARTAASTGPAAGAQDRATSRTAGLRGPTVRDQNLRMLDLMRAARDLMSKRKMSEAIEKYREAMAAAQSPSEQPEFEDWLECKSQIAEIYARLSGPVGSSQGADLGGLRERYAKAVQELSEIIDLAEGKETWIREGQRLPQVYSEKKHAQFSLALRYSNMGKVKEGRQILQGLKAELAPFVPVQERLKQRDASVQSETFVLGETNRRLRVADVAPRFFDSMAGLARQVDSQLESWSFSDRELGMALELRECFSLARQGKYGEEIERLSSLCDCFRGGTPRDIAQTLLIRVFVAQAYYGSGDIDATRATTENDLKRLTERGDVLTSFTTAGIPVPVYVRYMDMELLAGCDKRQGRGDFYLARLKEERDFIRNTIEAITARGRANRGLSETDRETRDFLRFKIPGVEWMLAHPDKDETEFRPDESEVRKQWQEEIAEFEAWQKAGGKLTRREQSRLEAWRSNLRRFPPLPAIPESAPSTAPSRGSK